MAQEVKDLMLSLLWHGFDPWPWNMFMPQVAKKKKNVLIIDYVFMLSVLFFIASDVVLMSFKILFFSLSSF